jgi:hypothetical protein
VLHDDSTRHHCFCLELRYSRYANKRIILHETLCQFSLRVWLSRCSTPVQNHVTLTWLPPPCAHKHKTTQLKCRLNQFEKRITRNLIEEVSEDAMKINVISRFLEWSVIKNKKSCLNGIWRRAVHRVQGTCCCLLAIKSEGWGNLL